MFKSLSKRVFFSVLGSAIWLALFSCPCAAADIEVLGGQTTWRLHIVLRGPVVGTAKRVFSERTAPSNWVLRSEEFASPLPDPDWFEVDFDDSDWTTGQGAFFGGYGNNRPSGAALLCVRGRFGVDDPARVGGLKLSLAYRGGVVVYVNGKELARHHLSGGRLDPLSLAEDYPLDVFVTPDGEALLPNFGSATPPANLKDRYEARIRKATLDIPAGMLISGINVLALELHRTAIPDELPPFGRGAWDTVGLLSATLTASPGSAVVANAGTDGGIQISKADPWARLRSGGGSVDPFAKVSPLELLAPRNGFASAQVVVSSMSGFSGLSAKASELKTDGGAAIPSAAVRLRYGKVGGDFVGLFERPIDGAEVQPVWMTVHVPPGTPAGRYTGGLSIRAAGKSVTVPIELTVFGWRVGNPKDWKTCVNVLQSPGSVAARYGVPLWSDRHFQLLEKSMQLMAEVGNDVLGVSAVGKSVFGDDPLIVFRNQGGRYVPEFKFLDRYLELYDQHVGRPQFFSLQVWSYGMYRSGVTRDGGRDEWRNTVIPLVELRGDRLVPIEAPIYGRPGTEETWRLVMEGLRERVEKLGWPKECILLGTSGDAWPSAITVNFFKRIAPYAQWRALTHGGGVPKWGISDHERTQPNDMVVGSTVCDRLTAYDIETGRERWRFYTEGPIRVAPAAFRGNVYVASDDGCLYCLSANDGKLRWKFRGGPTDRQPAADLHLARPRRAGRG